MDDELVVELRVENAALRERLADCIREATEEVAQERRRAEAAEQREAQARVIISELLPELPDYQRWSEVREQARAWLADRAEQRATSLSDGPEQWATKDQLAWNRELYGKVTRAVDAPTIKHPGHDIMCRCAECKAYWAAYFADDPDLDTADAPTTEQEAEDDDTTGDGLPIGFSNRHDDEVDNGH